MVLDENTIEKIAHLSRLQINNEDVPLYARNLSNILDFVGQMNAIDTVAVEPMAHPLSVSQRLRTDEVTEVNQRDKFQAIAPRVDSGLYLVPKVIE